MAAILWRPCPHSACTKRDTVSAGPRAAALNMLRAYALEPIILACDIRTERTHLKEGKVAAGSQTKPGN